MDLDGMQAEFNLMKRFLDATTDGDWRDPSTWRRDQAPLAARRDPMVAFRHAGDGGAAMVVDEEQTRRDRIALGLDADPEDPNQPEKPAGATEGDPAAKDAGDGGNASGQASGAAVDPVTGL